MPDLTGQSFTPGLQQRFRSALNGAPNQLPTNASQALQVLSLRLPNFVGGSPIAPDALLHSRLGGSTPDAAVRGMTSGPAPSALPAPPASPMPMASPSPTLGGGPVASMPGPPSVLTPAPDQAPGAGGGAPPGPQIIFHQDRPDGPGGDGGGFGGSPLLNLLNQFMAGGAHGGRA